MLLNEQEARTDLVRFQVLTVYEDCRILRCCIMRYMPEDSRFLRD